MTAAEVTSVTSGAADLTSASRTWVPPDERTPVNRHRPGLLLCTPGAASPGAPRHALARPARRAGRAGLPLRHRARPGRPAPTAPPGRSAQRVPHRTGRLPSLRHGCAVNPEGLLGTATELSRAPDVCARLLAEHVAGPDGRCAGCRSAVRLAPRWPCRLAALVQLAVDPSGRCPGSCRKATFPPIGGGKLASATPGHLVQCPRGQARAPRRPRSWPRRRSRTRCTPTSTTAAAAYGPEAAELLGLDPATVFKTLVADVDGSLTVGVVPVSAMLDLKALAAAVGGKRAKMADVAAAERATGYVAGGIPPPARRSASAPSSTRPRKHCSRCTAAPGAAAWKCSWPPPTSPR